MRSFSDFQLFSVSSINFCFDKMSPTFSLMYLWFQLSFQEHMHRIAMSKDSTSPPSVIIRWGCAGAWTNTELNLPTHAPEANQTAVSQSSQSFQESNNLQNCAMHNIIIPKATAGDLLKYSVPFFKFVSFHFSFQQQNSLQPN